MPVSFNPIDTVYTTYSSDEYDRSILQRQPMCFKLNSQLVTTASVMPCNATTRKPKLSINTHSLTPLFFTAVSTNYNCNDDNEEEGYLIPTIAY